MPLQFFMFFVKLPWVWRSCESLDFFLFLLLMFFWFFSCTYIFQKKISWNFNFSLSPWLFLRRHFVFWLLGSFFYCCCCCSYVMCFKNVIFYSFSFKVTFSHHFPWRIDNIQWSLAIFYFFIVVWFKETVPFPYKENVKRRSYFFFNLLNIFLNYILFCNGLWFLLIF